MFLPDNIDLGQSEKYVLSIRISPTIFSYSIHEPKIGGDFCYRERTIPKDSNQLTEIQSIIFDNNFLSNRFKETNIIYVSENYELIPEYLLEKGKTKVLYNFTHKGNTEQILESTKKFQNNIIAFGINKDIYTFLMRSLFNPQFIPHSFLILEYSAERSRTFNSNNKMFLNFQNEFLDIICYNKNSKIEQAITLRIDHEQNLLYHILNIWNKSQFDQQKDILQIFNIQKESLILRTLSDYIRNIEIVESPNETIFLNIENKSAIPIDILILPTV